MHTVTIITKILYRTLYYYNTKMHSLLYTLGASVCVCVSLHFDSNYLPVSKHQQGEVLLAMTAQTLTDWTWDDHDNPVAMPTSLYPNKE